MNEDKAALKHGNAPVSMTFRGNTITVGQLTTQAVGELRRAAIRFWERRRIAYNAALLPAAAFGYVPRVGICLGVGDTPALTDRFVIAVFIAYALGANVCYTFAYTLEFFLGLGRAAPRWSSTGRHLAFFAGTALAMLLAFFAALGIALAQCPDHAAR